MKLLKWFIPVTLLIVALSVAAMPAFAQGPTPTGKFAGDALSAPCDWVGIGPAPAPGYYSEVFYKIPYSRQSQLVVYMWATKTDPNKFFFDVYTPYDASLRYLIEDKGLTKWDNWTGENVGSSTPNKWELGNLSWAGKLDNGSQDGFYLVDLVNFYEEPVWYNLCYRVIPSNFR